MSVKVFDGTAFAEEIYKNLRSRVRKLKERGIVPGLAVIYGKGIPAAESYVRAKIRASMKTGVSCAVFPMSPLSGEKAYIETVEQALKDKKIHALILVKPFPKKVDFEKLEALVGSIKDAEGLNPFHFGRLFKARGLEEIKRKNTIVPATALACAEIAKKLGSPLKGKRALVIGRSNVVGKPTAHLLMMMDMTVTVAHSKTRNLKQEVQNADLVISAVGHPNLIAGSWIKKGAVVIDAGTSHLHGKITGDVDFKGALKQALWITPVPGGVGPVTTALLLRNVVSLAEGVLR